MSKKIIRLTESDLENIVRRVITEQEEKKITVNMEGTWNAGFHSVNQLPKEVKSNLDKQRQSIDNFIKQNRGSIIKFDIQVGESKVTNYDAENNRKQLNSGDLANMRGESIKKLFGGTAFTSGHPSPALRLPTGLINTEYLVNLVRSNKIIS